MACEHCFAPFHDVKGVVPKGHLPREDSVEVVRQLGDAGFKKITFAGGEPTLCPWLEELVRAGRRAGMTTMLVTNGSKLHELPWVFDPEGPLDWVTLSIDASSAEIHEQIGRSLKGTALSNDAYVAIAGRLLAAGVRLKVNTVVSRRNVDDDLSELINRLRPERWKLLQVLPVEGQNTDSEQWLIDEAEFKRFVDRHRGLLARDIDVVPEAHDDIRGTYAMVGPAGRFFDDIEGHHSYSDPILGVGVKAAWRQIGFRHDRFEQRGGNYDFEEPHVRREQLVRRIRRNWPRLLGLAGLPGVGKRSTAAALEGRGYVVRTVADIAAGSDLVDGSRVVTVVSTLDEFRAVRRLGGKVWRLTRSRAQQCEAPLDHRLAELPNRAFSHVIRNDGTLLELERRIATALHRC